MPCLPDTKAPHSAQSLLPCLFLLCCSYFYAYLDNHSSSSHDKSQSCINMTGPQNPLTCSRHQLALDGWRKSISKHGEMLPLAHISSFQSAHIRNFLSQRSWCSSELFLCEFCLIVRMMCISLPRTITTLGLILKDS